MNKIVKSLIRFLIEVIVIIVLIVGIRIFTDGMYLLGLPDLDLTEGIFFLEEIPLDFGTGRSGL